LCQKGAYTTLTGRTEFAEGLANNQGNTMNIEELTLKQIREIALLVNGTIAQPEPYNTPHPFVGKYVIARCYAAGVHAGTVVSVDGESVILKDSRRLWSWKAKDGVALSGVAQTGVQSGCKIDVVNPEIYLTGVCELIPCSSTAEESINDFKK
jgi:hypothetical protein